MKQLKIIILVFLLFQIGACDDFVDIQPQGQTIATSIADADLLLSASDLSTAQTNIIPSLINDNIQITQAELDAIGVAETNRAISNILTLQPEFFVRNLLDVFWNESYSKIGTANFVIELLEGIDTEDPIKEVLTAEARLHRAFNYFRLVLVYGPHFGLPEAAERGLGVPIVTQFGNVEGSLERVSVNEVYEFIMADIQPGLQFLPEGVFLPNRPTRAAALGLLAEVQLHMGNYAAAERAAADALEIQNTLFDFNTLTGDAPLELPNYISNPETIWFHNTEINTAGTASLGTIVLAAYSNELLNLTDIDNDLRYQLGTINLVSNNFTISQRVEVPRGISVPKLLLIRAECLARAGDFSTAMNLVNQLRANRFRTDFVASNDHILTAANSEEALTRIFEERRREFNVNQNRFFTIKRLNALENANISFSRAGATYTPNSINWAAPIAQSIINTSNGQIVQTPRE